MEREKHTDGYSVDQIPHDNVIAKSVEDLMAPRGPNPPVQQRKVKNGSFTRRQFLQAGTAAVVTGLIVQNSRPIAPPATQEAPPIPLDEEDFMAKSAEYLARLGMSPEIYLELRHWKGSSIDIDKERMEETYKSGLKYLELYAQASEQTAIDTEGGDAQFIFNTSTTRLEIMTEQLSHGVRRMGSLPNPGPNTARILIDQATDPQEIPMVMAREMSKILLNVRGVTESTRYGTVVSEALIDMATVAAASQSDTGLEATCVTPPWEEISSIRRDHMVDAWHSYEPGPDKRAMVNMFPELLYLGDKSKVGPFKNHLKALIAKGAWEEGVETEDILPQILEYIAGQSDQRFIVPEGNLVAASIGRAQEAGHLPEPQDTYISPGRYSIASVDSRPPVFQDPYMPQAHGDRVLIQEMSVVKTEHDPDSARVYYPGSLEKAVFFDKNGEVLGTSSKEIYRKFQGIRILEVPGDVANVHDIAMIEYSASPANPEDEPLRHTVRIVRPEVEENPTGQDLVK